MSSTEGKAFPPLAPVVPPPRSQAILAYCDRRATAIPLSRRPPGPHSLSSRRSGEAERTRRTFLATFRWRRARCQRSWVSRWGATSKRTPLIYERQYLVLFIVPKQSYGVVLLDRFHLCSPFYKTSRTFLGAFQWRRARRQRSWVLRWGAASKEHR